jgi:DNA polymerase-3 subunit delta'
MSFYRDVLLLQMGASSAMVNEEMRPELEAAARSGTPEATLTRIDEVFACRRRSRRTCRHCSRWRL